MKYQQRLLAGNLLMASGLGIIVVGVVTTLMNQLTSVQLPALAVNGAVFAIFMGALLWLTGAQIGGREKVCDRYYLLRYRAHSVTSRDR